MNREIGHLYSAKDHYNVGSVPSTAEIIISEGDARYSSDCIYGEHREYTYVLNDFTICDGCKTTLKNNMSRFDH